VARVSAHHPDDDLALALGRAIRRVRRRAGLTMVEVATRAGMSQPFLSQVENGRTAPSLTNLHRIATVLGTNVQSLLAEHSVPVVQVNRADDVRQLPYTDPRSGETAGLLARFLSPARRSAIWVTEITMGPGLENGPAIDHDGEEAVYVLEGALTVELDEDRVEKLGPGDSIYHSSSIAHRWRSGESGARFLVVSTSPA
jgi:transcriptional regulator with XRE-family HTH domain